MSQNDVTKIMFPLQGERVDSLIFFGLKPVQLIVFEFEVFICS